jgi:hypothetical protein
MWRSYINISMPILNIIHSPIFLEREREKRKLGGGVVRDTTVLERRGNRVIKTEKKICPISYLK